MTKKELYALATKYNVAGRSTMTKPELETALAPYLKDKKSDPAKAKTVKLPAPKYPNERKIALTLNTEKETVDALCKVDKGTARKIRKELNAIGKRSLAAVRFSRNPQNNAPRRKVA